MTDTIVYITYSVHRISQENNSQAVLQYGHTSSSWCLCRIHMLCMRLLFFFFPFTASLASFVGGVSDSPNQSHIDHTQKNRKIIVCKVCPCKGIHASASLEETRPPATKSRAVSASQCLRFLLRCTRLCWPRQSRSSSDRPMTRNMYFYYR